MSEHPPTWIEVMLGDLLSFNYGKSLPGRARRGRDFPVYGSNGVVGYHTEALTNGETLIIGRKGSGRIYYAWRTWNLSKVVPYQNQETYHAWSIAPGTFRMQPID